MATPPAILTLQQVLGVLQPIVTSFIPDADPNSTVRIAWAAAGQPGWKPTDGVVFMRLTPDTGDPYSKLTEITYGPGAGGTTPQTQSYTRTWRLMLTNYSTANAAFDVADGIRAGFLLPSTDVTLAAHGLAVIPDVPLPMRAPELFNGQWWDRCDLLVRLYEAVQRSASVPTVVSAPITLVPQGP